MLNDEIDGIFIKTFTGSTYSNTESESLTLEKIIEVQNMMEKEFPVEMKLASIRNKTLNLMWKTELKGNCK